MRTEKLTKELVSDLLKIKGECRGITLKVDWDFIRLKEGEKGIKKLEAKMKELDCPIKYKRIKTMSFYPIGLDVASMLSIKEVFNYDDKKLEEMGASLVQFSLHMKVFMKYFVSLRLIASQLPNMWRKHYTIGDIEMPDFSKKKRYVVLTLKDFNIHPVYCTVLGGCFRKVTEMVVNSSVVWKETKCPFRGDKYHKYLLTW